MDWSKLVGPSLIGVCTASTHEWVTGIAAAKTIIRHAVTTRHCGGAKGRPHVSLRSWLPSRTGIAWSRWAHLLKNRAYGAGSARDQRGISHGEYSSSSGRTLKANS